jgi:hypothetical protein
MERDRYTDKQGFTSKGGKIIVYYWNDLDATDLGESESFDTEEDALNEAEKEVEYGGNYPLIEVIAPSGVLIKKFESETYAKGGELKTLWKIPIEKGTGKSAGQPILLKKGTSTSIKKWLNKNKESVNDGWSGIQEWHGDATIEEVENYNQKFAQGGLVKKSDFTMLGTGLLIGGLIAFFKK